MSDFSSLRKMGFCVCDGGEGREGKRRVRIVAETEGGRETEGKQTGKEQGEKEV